MLNPLTDLTCKFIVVYNPAPGIKRYLGRLASLEAFRAYRDQQSSYPRGDITFVRCKCEGTDKPLHERVEEARAMLRDEPYRLKHGTDYSFVVKYDKVQVMVNAVYEDLVFEEANKSGLPVEHVLCFNVADYSPEVLPGATKQEVMTVMMQDIVGDYDVPEDVPEWAWVEQKASYAHARNGQDGIWEFVLNLSVDLSSAPARLASVIDDAKARHCAYLIIHQGT